MTTKDPGKKAQIRKVKFTRTEDLRLIELVNRFGCSDWKTITNQMKNRTIRQCRERWRHYLSPFISHEPWTAAEDALLTQKIAEFGNQWPEIAKSFPARTSVNVKNHWLALTRQNRIHGQKTPPDSSPRQDLPADPLFDEDSDNGESQSNDPSTELFRRPARPAGWG
jgi:hypothetical protein